MADTPETRSYIGHVLHDATGQKIGKIHNIYFASSGDEDWASVRHGLLAKTAYVPIGGTRLTQAGLCVPYAVDVVASAPDVRSAGGELAADELEALETHFAEHRTPVQGDSRDPGVLETPFTGSSNEATVGTGEPGQGEPGDVTASGSDHR